MTRTASLATAHTPLRRRTLTGAAAAVLAAAAAVAGAGSASAADAPHGVDLSHYNATADVSGEDFVIAKATQGTDFEDPKFDKITDNARDEGAVTGAYHFAAPDESGGAEQARYFVEHGGDWTDDGKTLPGALDLEGETCYGKSQKEMKNWVSDFADEYKKLTDRDVIIYTAGGWWDKCTGGTDAFADTNPLWVANYTEEPGNVHTMPKGFDTWTIHQYTTTNETLDQDVINGDKDTLKRLVEG